VQIFDLSQIDYDQPIDPSVWELQLPADVSWVKDPQKLPDNAKYASMTPEQAARAFFDACAQRDWEEAGKFMSPINQRLKDYLGGLEIVSLGQAFSSKAYGGRFVPYEIKLRPQEVNVRVSNNNPAKRYVITGTCDSQGKLHQELAWTNAPAVLPDNDAYAKLSPVDAVKAYCAAQSKQDWAEMKKFAPDYDVERDRRSMEEAQKRGVDMSNIMPRVEVGEAVWSPEQSAYLVKCYMSGIKKHNLALRKDNQAGRWQVDGGI
jgi:hypothetical protein